jgi:uncharacterized protein (DUF3084 family)
MFNVKISLPTYTKNSWGRLDKQGEVQISSDVNSLSQEYPRIKAQVDELLEKANAENRLILDLELLEAAREKKQNSLDDLDNKIEQARPTETSGKLFKTIRNRPQSVHIHAKY